MPTTSDNLEPDYKIEKDIPIPPFDYRQRGHLTKLRQTVKAMEIGDSIPIYGLINISKARSAAQREKRETGKVFTYRSVGIQAYRLWRVK